jgi:hypothetical protein
VATTPVPLPPSVYPNAGVPTVIYPNPAFVPAYPTCPNGRCPLQPR